MKRKANELPHFLIPIWPREVPADLLELPLDSRVRYEVRIDRHNRPEGITSAADLIAEIRATIERQARGWLTLDEAGGLLEQADRGDASGRGGWIEKLAAAAREGALPTQEPGTLGRINYMLTNRPVRTFHDLAHADDLNRWLADHESRLLFRFPEPTMSRVDEAQETALNAPPPVVQAQGAESIGTAPLSVGARPGSRTHRIARDLLAPVIDLVRSTVSDPTNTAIVMAELERLARLPAAQRPAPLAGATSGGIQWHNGGQVKVLTRKALGDRLRRLAQAHEAASGRAEART